MTPTAKPPDNRAVMGFRVQNQAPNHITAKPGNRAFLSPAHDNAGCAVMRLCGYARAFIYIYIIEIYIFIRANRCHNRSITGGLPEFGQVTGVVSGGIPRAAIFQPAEGLLGSGRYDHTGQRTKTAYGHPAGFTAPARPFAAVGDAPHAPAPVVLATPRLRAGSWHRLPSAALGVRQPAQAQQNRVETNPARPGIHESGRGSA